MSIVDQQGSDEIFDAIRLNTCPNCKRKNTLFVAAMGGAAMNVRCKECNSLYWVPPIRGFGAYEISETFWERSFFPKTFRSNE